MCLRSKCASISKTQPNFRRCIIFLILELSPQRTAVQSQPLRGWLQRPLCRRSGEQGRAAEGWQECVLCPAGLDLLPTQPWSLGLQAHWSTSLSQLTSTTRGDRAHTPTLCWKLCPVFRKGSSCDLTACASLFSSPPRGGCREAPQNICPRPNCWKLSSWTYVTEGS